MFEKSEPITISELKPKLEALVFEKDNVLILHGANSDLKVLHNLDIDLGSLYVIDTNKAAQFPLQLYYRYSLEKLLEALEIPYAFLHAAGNDAHFSLQALLMIAVRDAERQPDSSHEALIRTLRAISQAPRPLTAAEIQAPIEQARREAKAESRARKKARRAATLERQRLEREDKATLNTDSD